MISYHGTTNQIAGEIITKGVNVQLGGGELGQGFYSGEYLWEAKSWALQKHESKAVVEINSTDDEVLKLAILSLERGAAKALRNLIKAKGKERSYVSGNDTIWSPIVGSEKCLGNQYKWESDNAQAMLNGKSTTRSMK